MRCPNCGYENEMDSQFCGNCGAPLPPPEKKKSKAPLIIVIAVLVAVLLAGAIGFVAYNWISEKKEEELRQEQLEAEREQEEQEEQEEKERQEQEEKERQEQEEMEAKENWTAYRISQPATLGDSYKLTVSNASATSVIDQEGHDNSPAMMLDGKLETSWQEGVDGPGIGEQVTFYLDRVYEDV